MIYNLLEEKPELQYFFIKKTVIPYIINNSYLSNQKSLRKDQKVLIKLCNNYYDLEEKNGLYSFKEKNETKNIKKEETGFTMNHLDSLLTKLTQKSVLDEKYFDKVFYLYCSCGLMDYFIENLNKKRKKILSYNQTENEKQPKSESIRKEAVYKIVRDIVLGGIEDREVHQKAIKMALRFNLLDYYWEEYRKAKEEYIEKQYLNEKFINIPQKERRDKIQTPKQQMSDIYQLEWKNVVFYDGRYVFAPKSSIRKFRIQPLIMKDSSSLECFNYIKEYFAIKLPIIRYQYNLETGKITILDSIKLNNAIWMIKEEYKLAKIEKRDIKTGMSMVLDSVPFQIAISKAKQMTSFDFRKYKSKFIDYLVSKQITDACIVPMTEAFVHSNTNYTEVAFIFTINATKDTLTIVVENVNPDRSTILFEVLKVRYMEALKAIYSFMQGSTVNKRSEIREKCIVLTKYGVIRYCSINHEWLERWKRDILKYNRI